MNQTEGRPTASMFNVVDSDPAFCDEPVVYFDLMDLCFALVASNDDGESEVQAFTTADGMPELEGNFPAPGGFARALQEAVRTAGVGVLSFEDAQALCAKAGVQA